MAVKLETEVSELLKIAIHKLPEKGVISDTGAEIRTVVGINFQIDDRGVTRDHGMYRFSEDANVGVRRYILVQDTVDADVIRGVVIEEGAVTNEIGSNGRGSGRLAVDLLNGFLACKRLLRIKEE